VNVSTSGQRAHDELPRRSIFAREVIAEFGKKRKGLTPGDPTVEILVDFLTERVLAPEETWSKSPTDTLAGLPAARKAIIHALTVMLRVTPRLDRIEKVDLPIIAEGVFLAVIKYEFDCPFPLIFC
jgi:hypothetical protein